VGRALVLGALVALYGALGAGTAHAAGSSQHPPQVVKVQQNGNNVTVTFVLPDNPVYTHYQTRWNGPASTSSNEYQSTFRIGFQPRLVYTIPNVQYNRRHIFKVQAGVPGWGWTKWREVEFTTKLGSYSGPLTFKVR
jgi:hypothetical protein